MYKLIYWWISLLCVGKIILTGPLSRSYYFPCTPRNSLNLLVSPRCKLPKLAHLHPILKVWVWSWWCVIQFSINKQKADSVCRPFVLPSLLFLTRSTVDTVRRGTSIGVLIEINGRPPATTTFFAGTIHHIVGDNIVISTKSETIHK